MTAKIELHGVHGEGKVALVDKIDLPLLAGIRWRIGNTGYVCRGYRDTAGDYHVIAMQNDIMRPPQGMVVDFKNRNPLDCRRKNLRICTKSQDLQNRGSFRDNRSGIKGVSWNTKERKWIAQIGHQGKLIYIGQFNSKMAAKKARDEKAKELHGEFQG